MIRKILIACAFMMAIPAAAQPQTPPASGYGTPIGVSEALALIELGMEKSAAQGLKMVFAVVEPSGELVAFARMDDVPYGAVPLAQQKARTSARFRMTTEDGEDRVQNGRTPLLSAEDFVTIGGGVPIVVNGRIIGALGVSGATSKEDAAIASLIVAQR
jgi:glc operon protein GlcG